MIREAEGGAGGGGMPIFDNLKGVAAPLDIQNIDTDMIIPKEYLKTIKRTGLGFAAFAELRYQNPVEVAQAGGPDGVAVEVEDFVLNRPEYRERAGRDGVGTKIIVAGDNFGCGSSREHAPWSINGMGIRCIISSSFADIFHSNCMKNGMLPVTLPREQVLELLEGRGGAQGDRDRPAVADGHPRVRHDLPVRHRPVPQDRPPQRPRRHRPHAAGG